MSDHMIYLMGEMQEKDELIAQLTVERDSFKNCFELVNKENARLRDIVDQKHRLYVAAYRERYIARDALFKMRVQSSETLRAIEPQIDDNEPMPSAVVFGRGCKMG